MNLKYESVTICHLIGMRRLFIIRKDLHLSAGKLGAMIAHCAEGYWLWLIKRNLMEQDGRVHVSFDLDREIYDDYLNGHITKTICEAKNLNNLLQAREMALNLGLVENQDFGMINDAYLTELTPEWIDENGECRCTVGKFGKLLSEVFDRTPKAKRSKFSPFASYTGLSLCRMMLLIPSVRSFSFIRIRNFGLFVTLFEGDSLRIYFAPL